MRKDYKFTNKGDYLLVEATGTRNVGLQLFHGSEIVLEKAKENNCKYLLLDYRKVVFEVPATEAFNLVRVYETRLSDFTQITIAAVVQERSFEIAAFWEEIGKKRGFNNSVFTSLEAAENWLKLQAKSHL